MLKHLYRENYIRTRIRRINAATFVNWEVGATKIRTAIVKSVSLERRAIRLGTASQVNHNFLRFRNPDRHRLDGWPHLAQNEPIRVGDPRVQAASTGIDIHNTSVDHQERKPMVGCVLGHASPMMTGRRPHTFLAYS
jgi:hypothetical protein